MDHRFKLKQIWIETDLIADKSQQILLTQNTLPNRAEACKKRKERNKKSLTTCCLSVQKIHKKAKKKQGKVLEIKVNGVICANKQRCNYTVFQQQCLLWAAF